MQHISAQTCDGQRYFTPIFSAYDTSTVVYSSDGMTMDIYQPHGDSTLLRRSIVLIHGGNFYQGTSSDPFIYTMCQFFVQRGYVVASINYPVISDTLILQGVLLDSLTMYPIIIQTINEGKAAVRYLKANASALNIDSSWIVVGGESSGALVADHVAYMNDLSGVSSFLDSVINTMGGLDGNSGNPGYSSNVKAVLNYGGGLLNLDMLTSADHAPIYTAQGDSDHNVPFNCGPMFDGYTNFNVCGGGTMQPVLTSLGIVNQMLMFDSLDFEPWLDSTMAQTGDTNHIALYQVEYQSLAFLYQIECPTFTGINEISNVHVSLYPNPASTQIQIQTDAAIESVDVIDRLGQVVYSVPATGDRTGINVSALRSGIYLAKINLRENKGSAVRSFVVE
jgi:hypothetical protein